MLRRIVSGVTVGAVVCGALGLVEGCLTRPVETSPPITKTNFITSIPQGSIDKVDLLFDIDNSASMGDKQAYLSQAIPDLIQRLVTPNCVSNNDGVTITGKAGLNGSCTDTNSSAEFPPVHNLHIGILSSSLGPRLGDACPTTGTFSTITLANGMALNRHNDDQAHLIARTADPKNLANYTEGTITDAPMPDNFLDWFPPPSVNPSNAAITPTGPMPVTDPAVLQTDFQEMVVGVHQFGCGIESQLESWYRFLIQPDPYSSLSSAGGRASWVDVDTTILQQRADFLRPDSLVAILVLTDENDSEVDVRSFGGSAYNFMAQGFKPPRGTQVCLTNPNDPGCTSCQFSGHSTDANCKLGPYTSPTDWGYDLNLRHVHEKQKYGVSVQFPIQRYVLGLTSPKVPDRNGEYPTDSKGNIASSYAGLDTANIKCTNPLYAAKLPVPTSGSWPAGKQNTTLENQLCNLAPGTRQPGLIYYAHIGGVPHQLLQVNPSDANSPQKDTLTPADWQLILGNNPETFDYSGIDPHMVESYQSRATVPVPTMGGHPLSTLNGTPTPYALPDPISGYEWVTDSTAPEHTGLLVDREYACIFPLTDPTTGNKAPRQCDDTSTMADPTLQDSCDCQPPSMGSFTTAEVPPVCNPTKPTEQDYAKAYPTVRELELAHLLGQVQGANEGIISSLCPIHTFETSPGDPLYGYRPAMTAILNRLKSALAHQCLPQRLTIDTTQTPPQVPCLVLGTFPTGNGSPTSCTDKIIFPNGGYENPDPQVLAHFKEDQHAAWKAAGGNGIDPSTELTCQLIQLTPNMACDTGSSVGWCYIDDGSVKGCPQAILFNKSALTAGVVTSLQCIEASNSVLDAALPSPAPTSTATTPDDAGSGGD
jgi:hypothetical protein